MTFLQLQLSLAEIIFPVCLIVPTLLICLPQDKPVAALAVLYWIPIAHLWIVVAAAVAVLYGEPGVLPGITLLTFPAVGLVLTYALMKIAPFVLEVSLALKVD